MLNDAGERGASHGRLLGGEGQVVILHQHETDGVVGAHQKTFDEQRQMPADSEQFDSGGADGEQAAT